MIARNLILNALIAVAFAVPSPAHSSGQDANGDWMKQVEAGLKRNAERAKTLIVDWHEVCLFPKDSLDNPIDGGVAPTEDTTVELDAQLMLDSDKVSYRRSGRQWSWVEKKFVPWEMYATTDAKESKSLTIENDSTVQRLGFVHKDTAFFEAIELNLMPVLWGYRAMEKCCGTHGFVPADWNVSSVEDDANKVRCLILKRTLGNNDTFMSLAVDRDFLMTRFWIVDGERRVVQLDVDHKQSAADGWSISGWRSKTFDQNGAVGRTTEAKVIETQVNAPTPADYFELKFPEGTEIHDLLDRSHYTLGKDGAKQGYSKTPDPPRR
jgi:hypothetical protein